MLLHAFFTALHGERGKVRDTHGSSHQRRVMKRLPAETISWPVNTLQSAVLSVTGGQNPLGRWDGGDSGCFFSASATMSKAAVSQLMVRATHY